MSRRLRRAAAILFLAAAALFVVGVTTEGNGHAETADDLIGRKAAGEEFELAAVEAEKPKIVDMMAALEANVEAAKAARGRHPTARRAPDAAANQPAKRAAMPRPRKSA